MIKLHATELPGCFGVELKAFHDARGSFVKTFRATSFRELGLESAFTEGFYSCSVEGTIRGMHLQLPPSDGAKLVFVVSGTVLDVALDLRVGSPTYGRSVTFSLSSGQPIAAYIPRGVAHGFAAINGPATLVYNLSSEYCPELDTGIRWNSFGLDWPVKAPLLSARDQNLPDLANFDSPFRFAPTVAIA